MSWLAISNGRCAVHLSKAAAIDADRLVASGTLMIETAFSASADKPQIVVDLERTTEWRRTFRITLREDGELFVQHRQNREVTCALLRITRPDPDAILRINFGWNGPARQGLLSVENLETGTLDQVMIEDPQPWPLDDIAALVSNPATCKIDQNLTLLAVSNHIEPVGLPAGLRNDTLIETAAGLRPVGDLERGDLVLTAERGFQPVLWTLKRELPAVGQFAPIRLRAPFFGLTDDLVVSADHRIMIEGADAEYLFGADAVLIEARHLASLSAGPRRRTAPTVHYVQVILDTHGSIASSGTWVESLYLGDPAQRPWQLVGSDLSRVPEHQFPRHTKMASPLLKPYEAAVLVSAMCA